MRYKVSNENRRYSWAALVIAIRLCREIAGSERGRPYSDALGAGDFSKATSSKTGHILAFCFRSLWKRALIDEKYVQSPGNRQGFVCWDLVWSENANKYENSYIGDVKSA